VEFYVSLLIINDGRSSVEMCRGVYIYELIGAQFPDVDSSESA